MLASAVIEVETLSNVRDGKCSQAVQIVLGTGDVSRVNRSLLWHIEGIFQVIWSGSPIETVN